jgi:hypothetical protein
MKLHLLRRGVLAALLASFGLVACAEFMNSLEESTDEDTALGSLVRGANRLRKSFQDLDPSEEHYIGRSVAAQILVMPEYPLADSRQGRRRRQGRHRGARRLRESRGPGPLDRVR